MIVRAIRNGDPPGRFLKKDEKTGKWIDVGDKKAAEKTSQALREKTNDEKDDKTKTDPKSLGVNVLLPDSASFAAAGGGKKDDTESNGEKETDKDEEKGEKATETATI